MNDLHGILFAYRSDANLGELTRRDGGQLSLALERQQRII